MKIGEGGLVKPGRKVKKDTQGYHAPCKKEGYLLRVRNKIESLSLLQMVTVFKVITR